MRIITDSEVKKITSTTKPINRGSGREVYRADTGLVLKVDRKDGYALRGAQGWRQNQREVFRGNDSKCNYGLPRVYQWAPDYSWILVEEGKPFKTNEQLARFTGLINVWDLARVITEERGSIHPTASLASLSEGIQKTILGLRWAIRLHGLGSGDLEVVKHWGKARGRLMLLDSGC